MKLMKCFINSNLLLRPCLYWYTTGFLFKSMTTQLCWCICTTTVDTYQVTISWLQCLVKQPYVATVRALTFLLTHLPVVLHIMRGWKKSALVHVMACSLFGAKPLPEPMLIESLGTNFSEIWIKTWNFSLMKMHLKMLSVKWQSFFVQGEMGRMFFTLLQPYGQFL